MDSNVKACNANFVYIIAAIAATGGLLFGFDTGVISGAILFIKEEWPLSAMAEGLVVGSVLIGAVIGAATSGKIADMFGRRNVIIVTAVIFFLGSIGTAFAPDSNWLIAGRIVIGVAIGIASFVVPLYISEISPTKIRGALVSLNQLAITIGIVVSYLVDSYFASWQYGWRYMFFVGIIPALLLGIGMIFLPETPRWLMSQNKEDESRKILSKIDQQADIDQEILQMKEVFAQESGGSFAELLQPWLKPALIIGVVLMFFQQFTGINTVIYYAPSIFEMAGFTSKTIAILATVGVGVVNVLMTVVSIWLLDRLGRRPLLFIGLSGIILTLGSLGLAFYAAEALGDMLKWVAVGSLILFIASFAVSLGPICWLIIAEIYPIKVRGLAMSIATVTNWGCNFLVAFSFPTFIEYLGKPSTFWIYAMVGVAGLIFCYNYVPETKGHTLEEIESHWLKGKHPRELK